jgi:hypothetical protein
VRSPSAAELIRVWELGQGRKLWYRALLLLAPVFPDSAFRTLGEMTLGARNAHLLALRERLFGTTIDATVRCPSCSERIQFSASVESFLPQLSDRRPSAYESTFTCRAGDEEVAYRLLCSYDLAAVSRLDDASYAEDALASRAILGAPDGIKLSPQTIGAVADAIVTTDPLTDIRLGFDCAACGHEWTSSFDIASFLWTEIDAEVRRLFDDVHRLGAAYGWSEAAILTMSAQRRREYLTRAS